MIKTITLALASAALFAAPAASAAERETRTTGVTHTDLDLTTEDGRAELDRRIESAAKNVCGMNERATGSNMTSREARTCYRDAKRQLDNHFAEIIDDQRRGG
ncbi:hypothetical protein GCM10009127_01680 [Alteraurantiacibacter aestuarii]|uniref:UrcA family protein n=1 Tax=Alteraurantiacibacter aestuarii TaxID=650004 RepID=A0A844ZP29_9SPHN|nr:UrcA family protein [Alteraurantiacibacter aestuarii]MXO88577.1 UrcA family protein [Alteraurantiacibacter aestuarii]